LIVFDGALDECPAIYKVRDSKTHFLRSQVMYAVIQTGGKQYRVEPGKTLLVEKLEGDKGAQIVFDQVLLVSSGDGGSVTIGKPLVSGAKVTAEIVEQTRGDRLVVFKFRLRKNYVRRNGHRQDLTSVKIAAIQA
jgi:large subunit ribosomal protein L21